MSDEVKLLPCIPTPEMIAAAWAVIDAEKKATGIAKLGPGLGVREIWQAMWTRATEATRPTEQGLGAIPGSPERIPHGPYCYASHEPMDERGIIKLVGMCPFWERGQERAFCRYLNEPDDELGLLTDQVKICGVNDD